MNLIIEEKNSSKNFPTICLNMIVKDESNVIVETLNNLSKYINFDYWVISDTGSTDNTQQIIKDYFLEKGIPGELFTHQWKDFGYNRTKALESAFNKTDYLLIFDADDRINGDFKLPFTEGASNKKYSDRYLLKFGNGFEYFRPLLINNHKRWCFRGVLHEFLANLDDVNSDVSIYGNYYVESGRTGNRSQNVNKYSDDAAILKKAFEEDIKLPNKGLADRYAFYCARSYKDAGEKYHDDAIEWYKKVLDFYNWAQEKYYSALEIGLIYKQKNNMIEAVKYWLKSLEYDEERIEGLMYAIEYFHQSGQHILVNALYHKFKNYNHKPLNKLFINMHMYNDRLEFFNALSANLVNDKVSGYECSKSIIINNSVRDNDLNLLINNIFNYRDQLENYKYKLPFFKALDNMIATNNDSVHNKNVVELWDLLLKKNREMFTRFNSKIGRQLHQASKIKTNNPVELSEKSNVIITFTTCKRLDLFKETINSILNMWSDVEKINHWFCVDDNSSKEDRSFMKSTYSWIEYYMKTPEEKGHRASMNIIWNKLKNMNPQPEYWIHMEDDFLFYYTMDYVTQSINALKMASTNKDTANIKQIVFNRNYAETVDNYKCRGHLPTFMPNIVAHDYKREAVTHYQNSQYWPHYSFRPSMIDVKTILKLGNYDTANKFFERDYADRWNKSKYKTVFYNRITHRHIGRLTSEISSGTVKNAYELNSETQFNIKIPSKIKIVNLERRADRKQNMNNLFDKHDVSDYEFFKAVDGNELEPNKRLKTLFLGNDFGCRNGVIGCALSHFQLWKDLLEDKHNNYYIIFEDDISVVDRFQEILQTLMPELDKHELLFLGYSMFEKKREMVKDIYNSTDAENKVCPLDLNLYIGGTFSYTVNKVGAQKLIDYINTNGIKHGIDYLMKIVPGINRSEVQPQMVFSEWNEGSKQIDTDVQTNYKSLDFNQIIEDKFIFKSKLDQIGNDLYYHKADLEQHMLRALKDKNCVGFNTLGFYKNKIDLEQLTSSIYFSHADGLYIKKEVITPEVIAPEVITPEVIIPEVINITEKVIEKTHTNKNLRVKMIGNWCSSKQLCSEWSNMCEDFKSKWKNIEITCEDTNIDYYVIINFPFNMNEQYDPKRTIVFQMEPWIDDKNKNWGVKTWGEWANPDPNKFFKVFTHKTHLNNVQWQVKWPFYTTPIPVVKSKLNKIASICSHKNFDTGHILRNDFIKFVSDKNILDVWGRQNYHSFTNYKGTIPDDNKFNVYISYKYCFTAENNSELNYATEKIWECILCECLCFYWGCPNLEEYIDPMSFVRLPLDDPVKSLEIIKQAIDEDWWSQRIDVIKKTKERLLNEIGFFPSLQKLLG